MQKLKSFLMSRWALFVLGFLAYFSFAPYFIFPVMWFGLAVLARKNDKASHKESFWNTFCFGAGLGVSGMNWLTHAMLLDNGLYAWLIPGIWVGFGLFFGLYYGVTGLLASFNRPGRSRWLAFAGWFCIMEWVRAWAFSGFPWNVVGNIWNGYLPMLQTVSVVGVYGLGLITVLIFTAVGYFKTLKAFLFSVMALAVLYAGGAWRLYEAQNENVWGVRVRLVQPNIPCTLKWNPRAARSNIEKLIHLSQEKNDKITHTIWPESAVPFLLNRDEEQRLHLMAAIQQGSALITGAMRHVKGRYGTVANSIFVLDDLTEIRAVYDKAHLVPFGEYTPLRGIMPWDKFVPFESDIIAGPGPQTIPVLKAPKAGGMVCYEAIFSGEVVDKEHRPEWLINVTNDGWYGLSAGPHHHFAMAQTRAVEEGLPLARSANTGISAMVDPYGRIRAKLSLGEEGFVDSDLPRAIGPTPFACLGNKIPLSLAMILILISFFKQKSA